MANAVFANGREIACKAGAGKTICAFPDVCFTPPENPATPPGVPVPYPNTGFDSDTAKGSKTVKISDKEIMLKDQSYFKTSVGDEAGCAAKKGVITSKNKGKVYFQAWSMDVKFEGENVDRHLDLTTNNHASKPGDTPPWTFAKRMAMAKGLEECDDDRKKVEEKCGIDPNNPKDMKKKPGCPSSKGLKKALKKRKAKKKIARKKYGKGREHLDKGYGKAKEDVKGEYEALAKEIEKDECQQALKCFLTPEKPSRCCKGQTPHHLVPASAIVKKGTRGSGEKVLSSFPKYKSKKAPCICVTGPDAKTATHKIAHEAWADHASSCAAKTADLNYKRGGKAKDASVISYEDCVSGAKKTAKEVAPDCDPSCIEAQVNQQHLGQKKATKKQNETEMRKTMDDDHLRSGGDSRI